MRRVALAGSILLSAAFGMGACSSDNGSNGTTPGTGGTSPSGTGGSKGTGGGSGTGGSSPSGTGGTSSATGGSGSGTGGTSSGTGGSESGTGGTTTGTGGASSGTGGSSGDAAPAETGGGNGSTTMSFFVTSVGAGNGGNLGGLQGADAKCKMLAMAVSADLGAKNWKAYLSTATENARDRIGKGPWRNAKGEIIANDLEQLHDQGENGMLNATWPIGAGAAAKILDEKGMPVPTGNPQQHDILTGTNMMGMVDGTNHCTNWTATTGMVTVGHSNRMGGGRPPSWTTAHQSGCAPLGTAGQNVGSGGGRGSIYCFAAD
jgi:hypothetical protein